jgi:hypothetical protein
MIVWSIDGQEWTPVDDAVHFPGFPEEFDRIAPSHVRGSAPPYLTALPEPGLVQVSLGVLARTSVDWCMLVRRPANFPLSGHFDHFEGVVATGERPILMFINLRLTKTDFPIRLRADMPLVQAQPIPQSCLSGLALNDMAVEDALGADEWNHYFRTIAEPSTRPDRPLGAYAVVQRRTRRSAEARSLAAAVHE